MLWRVSSTALTIEFFRAEETSGIASDFESVCYIKVKRFHKFQNSLT